MARTFLARAGSLTLAFGSLLAPGGLGQAHATAADGPRCALHKDDVIEPGLTLKQADIAYRTPATASITCVGEADGHRITKPGTFTETGQGKAANCLGGAGNGTFTIVVPTDAGPQTITRSYTFDYTALPERGGLLGGKLSGDGFTGTIDMFPVQGDCATRPMTRIHTVDNIEFHRPV
ncbi:MAG TPA: hypothetical protein VHV82_04805 [Sporichthyaceae bacterium]|jgi:hypothetical protein|nr:hypothetical protein [Sporichthyaceae bacterium]